MSDYTTTSMYDLQAELQAERPKIIATSKEP